MVTVSRLNVVLDIDEESLPKYLSLGYDQVDPSTGKVIKKTVPSDVGSLRLAYKEHVEQIKTLMEENTALKAEVKSLKSKRTKRPENKESVE